MAVGAFASLLLLSSCGLLGEQTQRREDAYATLYRENPRSIVIMPTINETNQVELKDNFYATLLKPLAERGYYVFSPFLAKELMEQESAANAEDFIQGNVAPFYRVFGADAVLFTIIHRWEKVALRSKIEIDVEYLLRSTKTGDMLFSRRFEGAVDLSSNQGGRGILSTLMDIVVGAISTSMTDKVVAARLANRDALESLPAGAYHPRYLQDKRDQVGPTHVTGRNLK